MRPSAALVIGIGLASVSLPESALAQKIKGQLAPGSRIVISGTSNVHKWDCSTTKFTADIEAPASAPNEVGRMVSALEVTIPVRDIDCGNGGMTSNLRKAMHADQHPDVRFRMSSYEASAMSGGTSYDAVLSGQLTINGVEKPIQVRATVTPDGRGGVRAEGSVDLRTTDYDVQPVRALLGSIRTGDRVTIILTVVAASR
jgi:polyisoprenoid-binding protein YceI